MVLKTIEALYDGQVIRPDAPLTLEPNTRVRISQVVKGYYGFTEH